MVGTTQVLGRRDGGREKGGEESGSVKKKQKAGGDHPCGTTKKRAEEISGHNVLGDRTRRGRGQKEDCRR